MKQKNTPTEANKMAINLTHLQDWAEKITNKKKIILQRGKRIQKYNRGLEQDEDCETGWRTRLKRNTLAQDKGRRRL